MPNKTELPTRSELARPASRPAQSTSNTPPPKQRRVLKISLLIAGLMLIAAVTLVPLAAKWAINNYLKTQMSSTITLRHVGFNPFTGRVNLAVQKNNQLELGQFRVEWDWLPLLRRTLRLNNIHLKDVTVEIKSLADGGILIGDIHVEGAAKTAAQAIESGTAESPLYVDVRNVELENIHVKYTDPQLEASLGFEQLHLQATGAQDAAYLRYVMLKNSGQQMDFAGDIRISGLLLQLPIDRKAAKTKEPSTVQKLQDVTALVSALVKISGLHVELKTEVGSGRMTPVFRVASVELGDNAAIRLQGKGFRKPLDVTFQPVDLQIKNLDSTRPRDETSVTFETSAGELSTVRYTLSGQPLVKPLTVKGTGKIARFPLPPFSPLVERFLGYRIQRGKLNLDPNISVKQGLLDSTWDVMLNGFDMEKLKAAERDPMADNHEVPLETSLMLLKDKNGDIRLQVPLKADLNDPNKGFSTVFAKAISAGIEAGVRASVSKILSPIFRGENSKLGPLEFAPKDAALSKEAIEYLKEVGTLLADRPSVKLKIKGVGPADGSKLVEQRVENVKMHLTATYKIQPERLLIASPELSEQSDAHRVELSF